MYADDTKLYREIKTIEDQRILQKDLDTLTKWSEIWLLKFHPEKCFNLTLYSPVCEILHSVFKHVQYSPLIRYW